MTTSRWETERARFLDRIQAENVQKQIRKFYPRVFLSGSAQYGSQDYLKGSWASRDQLSWSDLISV